MSQTGELPGRLLWQWMVNQGLDEETVAFLPALEPQFIAFADTVFFASLATNEAVPVSVDAIFAAAGPGWLEERRGKPLGDDTQGPQLWRATKIAPRPFSVDELSRVAIVAGEDATVMVAVGSNESLEICGIAHRFYSFSKEDGPVLRLVTQGPGTMLLLAGGARAVLYAQGELREWPPLVLENDGPVLQALGDTVGVQDLNARHARPALGSVIIALLQQTRRARKGGLIVILPRKATDQEKQGVKYRFMNAEPFSLGVKLLGERERQVLGTVYARLAGQRDLAAEDEAYRRHQIVKDAMLEEAGRLGRWAAVDQALLFEAELTPLGAGYPVPVPEQLPAVHRASDLAGKSLEPYNLERHGARHRAAAAFVEGFGGIAFVVSVDGPAKCFIKLGDKIVFWPLPGE